MRTLHADGGGTVDLSDAVYLLNATFLQGPPSRCSDAADANDDGRLDLTTAVYLLNWLFLGGEALPPPGVACGDDPTADGFGCVEYSSC